MFYTNVLPVKGRALDYDRASSRYGLNMNTFRIKQANWNEIVAYVSEYRSEIVWLSEIGITPCKKK